MHEDFAAAQVRTVMRHDGKIDVTQQVVRAHQGAFAVGGQITRIENVQAGKPDQDT